MSSNREGPSPGPDLSSVSDLVGFMGAASAYRGPYLVTSEGMPGGLSTRRHFDGANYVLGLEPPSPVAEYRIIADGPNGGPTCVVRNGSDASDDQFFYESGLPIANLSHWSFGAQLPRMDPAGTMVRTDAGFEYRNPSPDWPEAVAVAKFEESDGRLVGVEVTTGGVGRVTRATTSPPIRW